MEQICRHSNTLLVTVRPITGTIQWVSFANYAGGVMHKHGSTASGVYIVTRNSITTSPKTLYDKAGSVVAVTMPAGASAIPLPEDCFGCTEIGFVNLDSGAPEWSFTLTLKG